jgi:hypothetical protein
MGLLHRADVRLEVFVVGAAEVGCGSALVYGFEGGKIDDAVENCGKNQGDDNNGKKTEDDVAIDECCYGDG